MSGAELPLVNNSQDAIRQCNLFLLPATYYPSNVVLHPLWLCAGTAPPPTGSSSPSYLLKQVRWWRSPRTVASCFAGLCCLELCCCSCLAAVVHSLQRNAL